MLKTSTFKLYGLVVPLVLGTVGNMVKANHLMAIQPPGIFLKSPREMNKPILSNTLGARDVPVGERLAVEANGGDRPPLNFLLGQVAQRELPNPITPPAPLPEPVPTPEAPPPSPLEVPVSPISPVEEGPREEEAIAIEELKFIGNTAFSSEELAEAVAESIDRPLTFAELLQAETAITQYYVDAGFINSGAVILTGQNLSDGTVTIQIIEGGLRHIIFNFIDKLQTELSAGSRPERSLLKVEVYPNDTFSVSLNIDNGRSPSVGSFRRGGEIREANLLGWGDAIAVNYANTDGSDKYSISHLWPVNPRNGAIALEYDRTTSDIVEQPFDVRGYRQDFLLTDNGVLVSAEALLPVVRIGEEGVIQVVPFIDFGTGWNSSGVEDREDNTLLGAGVGLQLRLG